MSSASQFFGGNKPTKIIVNATSTNGSAAVVSNTNATSAAKTVVSGELTANVLVEVLSLSGQGSVGFFSCWSNEAVARTHRIKLTVDGVLAFDGTTASDANVSRGIILVGSVINSAPIPDHLYFNKSLTIEYASNKTETGKTTFGYMYRMY